MTVEEYEIQVERFMLESNINDKHENIFVEENQVGAKIPTYANSIISQYNKKNDIYCPKCQAMRIFDPVSYFNRQPILFKTFACSGDYEHKFIIAFIIGEKYITKIAHYPSRYDVMKKDFNKFEGIIGKNKVSELARAIQLESFGFNIAAFLHYRRIFEFLIFQVYKETNIENKVSKEEFEKLKMSEKIDSVKEYLPEPMNEAKIMYAILSKGVHELEEEECGLYLKTMKDIIVYSLDEIIEKRKTERRKIELQNDIKQIHTKLSSKDKK